MRFFVALIITVVGLVVVLFFAADDELGDTGDVDVSAATAFTESAALDETATPTPVATLPPTAEPVPTVPPARTVTMTFSGDILSHGSVIRQAAANGSGELSHDYRPMFGPISERLSSADLSFCVLETPISPDDTNLSGYPIFNAPRGLADSVAAVGFDGCAVASNHAYDRGPEGVVATLEQLDRAGVGHSGTARSAEEKATPTIYEANGVRVAHLSYTYGLNGFVLPGDQPYLVNVTSADAILAEAERARAEGAEFVVVHLQWGNEYQSDPSVEQLDLAQSLTASPDIDLIVGNHVHVVQPIDRINGKWVVYGLGNLLSNQSAECCPAVSQNGVIVTVTISGNDVDGYEVIDLTFTPTRVDRGSYTVVSLPEALADPDLDPGIRAVYEESVAATTEAINRLGAALEPTAG